MSKFFERQNSIGKICRRNQTLSALRRPVLRARASGTTETLAKWSDHHTNYLTHLSLLRMLNAGCKAGAPDNIRRRRRKNLTADACGAKMGAVMSDLQSNSSLSAPARVLDELIRATRRVSLSMSFDRRAATYQEIYELWAGITKLPIEQVSTYINELQKWYDARRPSRSEIDRDEKRLRQVIPSRAGRKKPTPEQLRLFE